ncbi:hypothetical protein CXF46_03940 [Corynebacterium bovis]|nr:hypothetical protein CXF45_10860 [Corynebacterium bovis]RRQ13355.1 hypothetical protein CXF47_06055 [Corynebacterium bovis]RRQ17136.1 hypothetical protein CXF46_03940 [Corynebacterium bovis]
MGLLAAGHAGLLAGALRRPLRLTRRRGTPAEAPAPGRAAGPPAPPPAPQPARAARPPAPPPAPDGPGAAARPRTSARVRRGVVPRTR